MTKILDHPTLGSSGDLLRMKTPSPSRKLSRSDAQFSLSTPGRHRAPSITETILEGQGNINATTQKLSLRVRAPACGGEEDVSRAGEESVVGIQATGEEKRWGRRGKKLEDLPLEIQGLILDYIFGDIHSVTTSSTSSQPGLHRLASAMRHPRRKALTAVALVSPRWRELVQERIYRHIKVRGNRSGLAESADWFSENFHLTEYVRHIEFWVPVWAEKPPEHQRTRFMDAPAGVVPTPSLSSLHGHSLVPTNSAEQDMYNPNIHLARHMAGPGDDQYPCFSYPFSSGSTSATLSEIFSHVACFFAKAQIFTLEGGHCKKSNHIRQFPAALFPIPDRRLDVLPNIRAFAMRGAWNIMREYGHWRVMEKALPEIQEWHCSYAKPRPEAYATISSILSHLPTKLRHVNICLDGFYSKDGGEGHGTLSSSPQPNSLIHHLCERLGRIVPRLESLSFTGSICDCFFRTATEMARVRKERSRLRTIDLVVKSCCRLMVLNRNLGHDDVDGGEEEEEEEEEEEGGSNTDEGAVDIDPASSSINNLTPTGIPTHSLIPSPSLSTTSGITNMTFIRSFERLILSAVQSLDASSFPSLSHIRIRYVDLDSACPLLNPYFTFSGPQGGRCSGLWNEEILQELWRVRPGSVGWEELGDGIEREDEGEGDKGRGGAAVGGGTVRRKPKAIKASVYRVLADAR